MKKTSPILLSILICFTSVIIINAESNFDINIKVDNELIEFDVQPRINEDNRTLIPVRFVAENLGMTVDWKVEEKEVLCNYYDGEYHFDLSLKIGEKTGYKTTKSDNKKTSIAMDTQSILVEEQGIWRTLVPLRFLVESLDEHEISWDDATRTVNIYTKEFLDKKALEELGQTGKSVPKDEIFKFTSKETGNDVIYQLMKPEEENPTQDDYLEVMQDNSMIAVSDDIYAITEFPMVYISPKDYLSEEDLYFINTWSWSMVLDDNNKWIDDFTPIYEQRLQETLARGEHLYQVDEVRYLPTYPSTTQEDSLNGDDTNPYEIKYSNFNNVGLLEVGFVDNEISFIGHDFIFLDEDRKLVSIYGNGSMSNSYVDCMTNQRKKAWKITGQDFIDKVKYIGMAGSYSKTGIFANHHYLYVIDNPYYNTGIEITDELDEIDEWEDTNE